MATFGPGHDLLFVAVLALALPWLAGIVIPILSPLAARLDPRGYWFLQTAHQLSSLALTLMLMKLVSTRPLRDWGFNLRRAGESIGLALLFALLTTIPLFLLMDEQPAPTAPITTMEIAAVLVSHFVIIGFTQEALFRGFAMTFLARRWRGVVRLRWVELPTAGIWAAAIFALAHVKPSPPYVWPAQLGFAFAFGLLYAVMYHRTRSLLGPSLAHGYSNTSFVGMMLAKYGF